MLAQKYVCMYLPNLTTTSPLWIWMSICSSICMDRLSDWN